MGRKEELLKVNDDLAKGLEAMANMRGGSKKEGKGVEITVEYLRKMNFPELIKLRNKVQVIADEKEKEVAEKVKEVAKNA